MGEPTGPPAAKALNDGKVLAQGVTAADFRARSWPAKVQLVDGAAVVTAPGPAHGEVAGRIFAALVAFTTGGAGRGVAGMGVEVAVDGANVYVPDGWWVRAGRPDGAASRLDAVPDIAVEVRSPATWRFDTGAKRRRYGEAGVAELWLVDAQARRIVVHRRTSVESTGFDDTLTVPAGELLLSPLLPGFSLDLDDILRR